MKKFSILALSATVAITPAYAETTAHYNTPITELTPVTELSSQQADLSFAFDDAENLQAVAMTDKQMEETQGAWVPNVVGGVAGGLGGHFGYMSSVVTSGQYNFGGHLASVGLGALGGVASPATGIGSVAWGLGFGTASGAATGYLTSKFPTINVK